MSDFWECSCAVTTASASAPGKQLPLKCVGLAFERSLRARVAPGVYAHGDSVISDISYHKKEEMLQNTPAGSVGSTEMGPSQEDLMQTSSSQRLWCPMGSPVLPPLTAGAHLGGQVKCRGLFSGVSISGDFLQQVLAVWRSPCYYKSDAYSGNSCCQKGLAEIYRNWREICPGGWVCPSALSTGFLPAQRKRTMLNSFNFFGIWRTGFGQKGWSSSYWKMVVGIVMRMMIDSIGVT